LVVFIIAAGIVSDSKGVSSEFEPHQKLLLTLPL